LAILGFPIGPISDFLPPAGRRSLAAEAMSDCLRSVKRVRMLPAIRGAVPRGGFDADPAGVRLALPATCHRRLHRRVVHVLRVGDLAPLGARRQRQHNEERGEGPDRVVAAGLRFGVRRREIVVAGRSPRTCPAMAGFFENVRDLLHLADPAMGLGARQSDAAGRDSGLPAGQRASLRRGR